MDVEGAKHEPGETVSFASANELNDKLLDLRSNLDKDAAEYLGLLDELHDPFVSLLADIKTRVEEGKIATIVADDIGGRVPALILRKIINRHNEDRGMPDIPIVFIQSQKAKSIYKVDTSGDTRQLKDAQDPVLVVTEYVAMGETLSVLLLRLADQGIRDVTIAALTTSFQSKSGDLFSAYRNRPRVDERLGEVPMFIGSDYANDGENALAAFDFNSAKGMMQSYTHNYNKGEPAIRLTRLSHGKSVASARQAADVFAQELYSELF